MCSFWVPSLTHNRTFSLHIPASGNQEIPKGQWGWVGASDPTALQDKPCKSTPSSCLHSLSWSWHRELMANICSVDPLPVLNSKILPLLFKNIPRLLPWCFLFWFFSVCMGRRGNMGPVRSCRTSHSDVWGRWVCKAFRGKSWDNERQRGESRTGFNMTLC